MTKRTFELVSIIVMSVTVVLSSRSSEVRAQQPARWTVFVFMNGDNNLEKDALINFRQMARVGSTDDVNVIVQFDRIAKYAHTSPDWSQTLRFRVTKNMEPLPDKAVQDVGEANMGDGNVLKDFVAWGQAKYPAQHYMLVVWDHGQGWRVMVASLRERQRALMRSNAYAPVDSLTSLRSAATLLRSGSGIATEQGDRAPFRSAPGDSYRSASNDETNNDVLYNREAQDALRPLLSDHPLDIIGFDACLMSMIETGYAFKGIAKYLVASEELEPGLGWDYADWLGQLVAAPTQSAAHLAAAIVASYRKTYTSGPSPDPETTMAAVDLGQMQSLATAVSNFSDLLTHTMTAELQHIVEARAATSNYAPGYGFFHVDLAQFASEINRRSADTAVKSAATSVQTRVTSAVLANYAGADRQASYGSHGVAIYFPDSNSQHVNDGYSEGGYEKTNTHYPVEFVQKERWTDFLHELWSKVP